jgi:hypothetical protein
MITNGCTIISKYPMLHANVDGIVSGPDSDDGILEIKTTTSRRVKRLDSIDDVPTS